MSDIENLLDRIKFYQDIIVFGTGNVAKAFTETFKITGLSSRIKYYAVSGDVLGDTYLNNISIKPIDCLTEYKDSAVVIIATADKYCAEIERKLKCLSFRFIMHFTFESSNWSILREVFFTHLFAQKGYFYNSWSCQKNSLKCTEKLHPKFKVYMIKSHKDKSLTMKVEKKYAEYLIPLQVGKSLTHLSVASLFDNVGENISSRNESFCELTGHYWIWRNVSADWVGVCHYRRHFELTASDISMITKSDFDIVLTVPILNVPSVSAVYAKDHEISDWSRMLDALKTMYPDYYDTANNVFNDVYYYAYNMMIARKSIFDEYCSWLFPLLFEIEKRCTKNRTDSYQRRYIGFLAERLTSLFFIHNSERWKTIFARKIFYG